MRHQEVKIKVVNPLDYFQPPVGHPGSTENVSRPGFGKSKLVMGRNKGPPLGSSPNQVKKGRIHGSTYNTTYTFLVQDPAATQTQSLSQVDSALEMNGQP